MTTARKILTVKEATVILWRHAPTPDNAAGRLQGRTDTPPCAQGLKLGRKAALEIVQIYGAPDRVFSSPLQRATSTAQELVNVAGSDLEVEIEPGINQRSYGVWEGKTLVEVNRDFPEEFAVRGAGGDPNIPGWELGTDVGARVAHAIESQSASVLETMDRNPVLVFTSHGSAISTGTLKLLGLNANQQIFGHLRHANWVQLRLYDGRWTVERYNFGPN